VDPSDSSDDDFVGFSRKSKKDIMSKEEKLRLEAEAAKMAAALPTFAESSTKPDGGMFNFPSLSLSMAPLAIPNISTPVTTQTSGVLGLSSLLSVASTRSDGSNHDHDSHENASQDHTSK
jgi:hypothetical protein